MVDFNTAHLDASHIAEPQLELTVFDRPPGNLPKAVVRRMLMDWGTQSNAYFNLQEGMKHFGIRHLGLLSYHEYRGLLGRVHLAFGNPVVHPDQLSKFMGRYHDEFQCPTIFGGVDEPTAHRLAEFGYTINDLGSEYIIPVQDYKIEGKSMRWLRRVSNMDKKGVSVREQSWSAIEEEKVKALSLAWRETKKITNRELKVMTRPPVFGNEWGVRKFYAYDADENLLGYVFFDPYFRDGKTVGYTANITRTLPNVKPAGVKDFLILEALKVFKKEGIESLSLGLAPLHGIEPCEGESPFLRWLLQKTYQHGNQFYSFKSLGAHKQRYKVAPQKCYAATRGISPLAASWVTAKSTNAL